MTLPWIWVGCPQWVAAALTSPAALRGEEQPLPCHHGLSCWTSVVWRCGRDCGSSAGSCPPAPQPQRVNRSWGGAWRDRSHSLPNPGNPSVLIKH